jgi:hypothetical protein
MKFAATRHYGHKIHDHATLSVTMNSVQQNYFLALLNQILPNALLAEYVGATWLPDSSRDEFVVSVKRRAGGYLTLRLPMRTWGDITLGTFPDLTDNDKARLVLFFA